MYYESRKDNFNISYRDFVFSLPMTKLCSASSVSINQPVASRPRFRMGPQGGERKEEMHWRYP